MAALSKEQQANGNETQTHQHGETLLVSARTMICCAHLPKELLSCRDTWLGPE